MPPLLLIEKAPTLAHRAAIRRAVAASVILLTALIVTSVPGNAGTTENNCQLVPGRERVTCCSGAENTTVWQRMFGGGCSIISRGDLGHGPSGAMGSPAGTGGVRGPKGNNGNNGNN